MGKLKTDNSITELGQTDKQQVREWKTDDSITELGQTNNKRENGKERMI